MENNSQPTFANGKICYIEIPALDIQQSSKFYQTVFGWTLRNDNEGNISFDDTVGQVSGMWVLNREPTSKAGLLISIMVNDIADTLKLIVENNGKVVEAASYNSSEVTARFLDPAGNIFCLYQEQH
jgi:predicted enzyme related to lactoylglutathione lyase